MPTARIFFFCFLPCVTWIVHNCPFYIYSGDVYSYREPKLRLGAKGKGFLIWGHFPRRILFVISLRTYIIMIDERQAISHPWVFFFPHLWRHACMILDNACSPFGFVNTAIDVVLGNNGKPTRVCQYWHYYFYIANFITLDDIHILWTNPPRFVLFQPFRPRQYIWFWWYDEDFVLVFPVTRYIHSKDNSPDPSSNRYATLIYF